MVFYGQPDHPSGAVALAADDTGASTALALNTDLVPDDVTEILLVAQTGSGQRLRAEVTDGVPGPVGHLDLPTSGPSGLLQIGALNRAADGWALLVRPDARQDALADLATSAGVDIA